MKRKIFIMALCCLILSKSLCAWFIPIDNKTDTTMTCFIVPRMDIGKDAVPKKNSLQGTTIQPHTTGIIKVPVWQENINPYAIIATNKSKQSISWRAVLTADSKLTFSSTTSEDIELIHNRANMTDEVLKPWGPEKP